MRLSERKENSFFLPNESIFAVFDGKGTQLF